jgi:hypothetical protein
MGVELKVFVLQSMAMDVVDFIDFVEIFIRTKKNKNKSIFASSQP